MESAFRETTVSEWACVSVPLNAQGAFHLLQTPVDFRFGNALGYMHICTKYIRNILDTKHLKQEP